MQEIGEEFAAGPQAYDYEAAWRNLEFPDGE